MLFLYGLLAGVAVTVIGVLFLYFASDSDDDGTWDQQPWRDHARRVANLRLQGIALALAELSRAHKKPDLAAMVMNSLRTSVAELEAAGADADDLAALTAGSQ